jgi:anti-sigma regulatory factor (Ser/Thr protein kinase)
VAAGAVAGRAVEDDLAILVTRVLPLGDELHTTWPADPRSLSDMRHLLQRWMKRLSQDPDELYEITVAVQEACSNAIEHAYSPGAAAVEMHAGHAEGVVEITVRDHGRWRPARGEHRGRGLPIMESLMDTVDVERGEGGTTVRMTRTLGRRS